MTAVGALGRSQVCYFLRDTGVIRATGTVLVHMNSLVLAGQGSLKK